MAPSEVIAAIATAPGKGGIGVVRISGKGLESWFLPLFGQVLVPRVATYSRFLGDKGVVLDQGIALFFPGPGSFTGEDVIELQGHGGPVVLQMVLQRCLALGARLAEPGEFSKRAYINGKLDLAQAEAVADLIEASTAAAARSALRSLSGEFSSAIHQIAEKIISLRTQVEAELDFSDEEIELVGEEYLRRQLADISCDLEALLNRARAGSYLRTGLHVVLVGRPNVGKSSLLNRFVGEELAIVTDVPGTTRDSIRERIELHGIPVHVVDTAGLRETDDAVEQIGIARTWREIERSDVVLYVVDAGSPDLSADDEVLRGLPVSLPRVTVHNKADLSGGAGKSEIISDGHHVWVSAKTGEGIDALSQILLAVGGVGLVSEESFIARERHVAALRLSEGYLNQAGEVAFDSVLFAEELRLAHQALASIVGEFSSDDLLGEIFSKFCIGK